MTTKYAVLRGRLRPGPDALDLAVATVTHTFKCKGKDKWVVTKLTAKNPCSPGGVPHVGWRHRFVVVSEADRNVLLGGRWWRV